MTRPDRPSATPAILVVDDEPDIRALARDALGGDGYRIVTASSYREALGLLRGVRFALVLADTDALAATEQAGRAALDRLLAVAGDTPVVICSAHDPARFADHAARGFAGTLPKPFDLGDLLATAAAHTGHAAPGEAGG